jgi:hypothetical protein
LHDRLNLVQSFRTYVPIAACDDGDAAHHGVGLEMVLMRRSE